MSKGEETRQHILAKGLDMASAQGLKAVTIGELAKRAGLSKSGLYAHFQSKEKLQIDILCHAGDLFIRDVVAPARLVPKGIGRIWALIKSWRKWEDQLSSGCFFAAATNEFSSEPGHVLASLQGQQKAWHRFLCQTAKGAVETGEFRTDTDCDQFAFELYSLFLGFHLYVTLLHLNDCTERQQEAFTQLIDRYRTGKEV